MGHIDRRSRETLIRKDASKGRVGERLDLGTRAVRDHAGTAQVVSVPIVRDPVRGDRGHPSGTRPDEPAATRRGSSRIAFIQLTDVPRRRGPHDLLHPLTITVIDEGGVDRGRAERGHRTRQAIIDVKGCTGAEIAGRTRDARLIAIVVVAVLIGARGLDGMRPHGTRATGRIGIGARDEPRVRQDIADLVIGIGERVRRVDRTGQSI